MADATKSLDEIIMLPEYHLRAILLAVCDDVSAREKAIKYHNALRAVETPTNQLKRKIIQDIWICVQCKQPFSYEYNKPKNCHFHPGRPDLNQNAECWEDMDDAHFEGLSEDEEMMEENPIGYPYSCCGEPFGSKPCAVGQHEAHPRKARADYSAASDEPNNGDDVEEEGGEDEGEDEDESESDEDEPPPKKRRG